MRVWGRLAIFAAVTIAILWVMRTPSPPAPLEPAREPAPVMADLGSDFNTGLSGPLTCQVIWDGPPPIVPPLSMFQAKTRPGGKMELPNPNAPRIGKRNGLADAFVYLRGVDLKKSRHWDLPPVSVEVNATEMTIHSGETASRFGVVRRSDLRPDVVRPGENVQLVSREPSVHGIRGRGADFFTQMLFVPNSPVNRRFSDEGIVELSSGSWYFWMRGYLMVSDHPYVGVSDTNGTVRFDKVPEGEYEVICWKANWHIAEIERDPEWIFQTGIVFHAAVEKRTKARVVPGRESERVLFKLNAAQFASNTR
jgi:hypothetical protein